MKDRRCSGRRRRRVCNAADLRGACGVARRRRGRRAQLTASLPRLHHDVTRRVAGSVGRMSLSSPDGPASSSCPVPSGPNDLVVGFDLDMTLVDSRPGIGAVYDALSAETGVPIDSALVTSRLGPPLEVELANWFPTDRVPAMVDRYRALYPELSIEPTVALPGAVDALAAVHRLGGSTMVVTSKFGPNAQLHVDHLGLAVDHLVGGVYAAAKGPALAERGAVVYVGDHTADIEAARAAGTVAVAVATGPFDADALRSAGADVVLDDLRGFPVWLAEHLRERAIA
jgi:phosphoglycolate phosphatase